MMTPQMATWSADFGRSYTDRNPQSWADMDALYASMYGVPRSVVNAEILRSVDRSARVLEVGCNVGCQLEGLTALGFTDLHGLELQEYAAAKARARLPSAAITCGSALELPFPDASFDLVYTSGVLIHIAPADLPRAMREILRVSRRFVWGWEYHADALVEIPYRGERGLLWKGPYAELYRASAPELAVVARRRLPYAARPEQVDEVFLLASAR
ncbi:MAG: methyltransferase domain-containing protein [Myxococcales bacterium]|nr:methyltransferase domain-containing protein [Myxococcales bacterium]